MSVGPISSKYYKGMTSDPWLHPVGYRQKGKVGPVQYKATDQDTSKLCLKYTHVIRCFYPIFSSSGLSVTCESGFSCEVFATLHSDKDTGLTAGHVHSDAAPSAPRKNLRWIMACKPLSSQPLGEKNKRDFSSGVVVLSLTQMKFK